MAAALLTPSTVTARPAVDPRAPVVAPSTLSDLGIGVSWVNRPPGQPLLIVGSKLRFDVTRRKGRGVAPPLIIKLVRYTQSGQKIAEGRQRLRERSQPNLLVPTVMQYIEPGETGGSYVLLEAPLIPGRYRAEWFARTATGPALKAIPSVEFGVGTESDPCRVPPGCIVQDVPAGTPLT